MVNYREIIRLKSTKPEMSNTMTASSIGSSRNTVEYSGRFYAPIPESGQVAQRALE